MRRASWVLFVAGLLLSACYQVSPTVVEKGVAAPGWRDGIYGRDDGTQVEIRWDGGQGAYVVGAGGTVRLAPLAGAILRAHPPAAGLLVWRAGLAAGGAVVSAWPSPAAERQGVAAHGLSVRPGPIPRLDGSAESVRHYFAALAAQGRAAELTEAARLRWLHS